MKLIPHLYCISPKMGYFDLLNSDFLIHALRCRSRPSGGVSVCMRSDWYNVNSEFSQLFMLHRLVSTGLQLPTTHSFVRCCEQKIVLCRKKRREGLVFGKLMKPQCGYQTRLELEKHERACPYLKILKQAVLPRFKQGKARLSTCFQTQ